jgi:hypothetical protein
MRAWGNCRASRVNGTPWTGPRHALQACFVMTSTTARVFLSSMIKYHVKMMRTAQVVGVGRAVMFKAEFAAILM